MCLRWMNSHEIDCMTLCVQTLNSIALKLDVIKLVGYSETQAMTEWFSFIVKHTSFYTYILHFECGENVSHLLYFLNEWFYVIFEKFVSFNTSEHSVFYVILLGKFTNISILFKIWQYLRQNFDLLTWHLGPEKPNSQSLSRTGMDFGTSWIFTWLWEMDKLFNLHTRSWWRLCNISNFAMICSTGISHDTTFKAISLSGSMILSRPVMTNSGSNMVYGFA